MKVRFKPFHGTLVVFILGSYLTTVSFVSSKAESDIGSCAAGVLDETNTTCYIYRSDVRTWQESELICQSLGGHLVSIQSPSESETVRSVLQSLSVTDDLWLGGHLERLSHSATRLWRWISDCGSCGRDTNADQAVSAQGCYKDLTAVHDLPYNISRLERILTPDACIEACRNGGFWFAGVQSGNRCFCGNSFGLYGMIDSSVDRNNCVVGCSGDSSLRCGGTDLNFIYFVPGGFAAWGYAKPNNYLGYQTCTILSQAIEFKFDDDDCGKTLAGFICDIPKTDCVNGSVMLNDSSCYYFGSSESVTWFKAREDCLRRGGDLLKVKDQIQLNALKSSQYLKASKYWIGLVGLVWFWSNGADLTYSNWYDVGGSSEDWEPNEVENECIIMSAEKDFQWMDGNCNLLHGYLCQITIAGPSTVQTTTQHLTSGSSSFSGSHLQNVVETGQTSSSQERQTTSQHVVTLQSSGSLTTANLSHGENQSGANLSNTSSVDYMTPAISTMNDDSSGLTRVEKALIAICVILFIIMIVMLILLLIYRHHLVNQNKVDGNRVHDDSGASHDVPESTMDKQALHNSNNHSKETDRIVSKDDSRKTKLVV